MNIDNNQPMLDSRTFVHQECTSDKKDIRFASCIGCADMGTKCLGPNLAVLPIAELRIWVKRWKEYFRLTVEQCAAIWNTPVGTVSRFLASQETDFKYMTVQNIVRGIIGYGQPVDLQMGDNPCPATSAQVQDIIDNYEKQLIEKTEECAALTARKLDRANEYTERMAEQRDNYEKHLAEKTDTIEFLRGLAEKRQKDLEKEEMQSADYLKRIDAKNDHIAEQEVEIRRLNTELVRLYASHSVDIRDMTERILKMAEQHSLEIREFLK